MTMTPYWDTSAQYHPTTPTYQCTGTPRLSPKMLLFAQVRGIIEHIGTYAPWVSEQGGWQSWNGVDALEVFGAYAWECGYLPLCEQFSDLGGNAYQEFVQYWNDCLAR